MRAPRVIPVWVWIVEAVVLAGWQAVAGSDPSVRSRSVWPPKGRSVRVPVTRDTWVSAVGDEQVGNTGGEPRFKLKGIQEMTLIDADWSPLKGRRITGALLHMKCLTPDAPARRVSVSTVATPWEEGTGRNYQRQEGSACFVSPSLGRGRWAYEGSTLVDAAWGRGHTIWRFADAESPDRDGWQVVAVEPDVIAANVAGLSHGLALMDDVGSEWSERSGKFEHFLFLNRFFASREMRGGEPWLEVWTDGEDREPPDPVTRITVETRGLPSGQALIRWRTPQDHGGGHTLGFHVALETPDGEMSLPRYLIPMARAVGNEVRLHLRDLSLGPGQQVRIAIRSVDASGNISPAFRTEVRVSEAPDFVRIEPTDLRPFLLSGELPRIGGMSVAVLDLLDKVELRTGQMVPEHPSGYRAANHLWCAARREVRLQAARNEMTGFLLHLHGQAPSVDVQWFFSSRSPVRTRLYRLDGVETASGGIMPDAAVPWKGPTPVPSPEDPESTGVSHTVLLAELYVPHDTPAGTHTGTVRFLVGEESLDLQVGLTVWDFTLPNKLSFIPEMNAYGTANPTSNVAYYRLAHEHRTCLNRLFYGWRCVIGDQGAPQLKEDGTFDWDAFDRHFGPLFDGSAFQDLPRKGEPVDVCYLPLNENWPVPMSPYYRPSYWADEAFDPEFAERFRAACAEFARHFHKKGWTNTIFEFYLNNKVYYRKNYPLGKIPAAWILDEPVNAQDFWALRWYAVLFHQGTARAGGGANFWYRADISRTQYSRNILWGVLDIEYMGGANAQKARMKEEENLLWQPTYHMEYGSANALSDPNLQPVIWCLLAWSRGAIGVLPWQTIGKEESWRKEDALSLFYPSPLGPVASVRLKAFTRGQQDVEYLTLLADVMGVPRTAVAEGMRRLVHLGGAVVKTSEEDAGTLRSDPADPMALWRLRTSVGEMISARKPAYRRAVRDFPTVRRDMTALPPIGYVTVAPPVRAVGPELYEPGSTR